MNQVNVNFLVNFNFLVSVNSFLVIHQVNVGKKVNVNLRMSGNSLESDTCKLYMNTVKQQIFAKHVCEFREYSEILETFLLANIIMIM